MRYQSGMVAMVAMATAGGCADYSDWNLTECPPNIPDACGEVCVDVQTDPNNCGACGVVCPTLRGALHGTCAGGECGVGECAAGRADCDGQADNGCETNLSKSKDHCGGCETACATSCLEGACDDPVFVSAGALYTCAIRASGSVWCWGDNTWGNLGVGDQDPRWTPVRVKDLSQRATTVATGRMTAREHTCALLADATVACWGANGNGQLGTGNTQLSANPIPLTNLPATSAVAVGGTHTCAISKAHELRCWGGNDSGQVGDGMAGVDQPQPTLVKNDILSVRLGAQHTCAVTTDKSVWCWGANAAGQVGIGVKSPTVNPLSVPGLANIVGVGLGAAHTCALTTDGTVKCWGANDTGQLGTGQSGDAVSPTLLALKGVLSLHVGPMSSAAILPDGAWVWGANDAGQLGTGDTKPTLAPVLAKKLGKVKQLSLGGGHGCAILESGALACWGANDAGQLGTGDTTPHLTPTVVSFSSEAP